MNAILSLLFHCWIPPRIHQKKPENDADKIISWIRKFTCLFARHIAKLSWKRYKLEIYCLQQKRIKHTKAKYSTRQGRFLHEKLLSNSGPHLLPSNSSGKSTRQINVNTQIINRWSKSEFSEINDNKGNTLQSGSFENFSIVWSLAWILILPFSWVHFIPDCIIWHIFMFKHFILT